MTDIEHFLAGFFIGAAVMSFVKIWRAEKRTAYLEKLLAEALADD